jgi:hypothetical protein
MARPSAKGSTAITSISLMVIDTLLEGR